MPQRTMASSTHVPRRILQVITPSHLSGAEIQLVRMIRQMETRGHRMPVIAKRDSPALSELVECGIDIDPRAISGKLNPLALAALARAVADHHPDLVQSALSTASWWCGWLEQIGGPPTIGHVHGFTSARWHRHQTHLLAVSAAVKRHLVDQGIQGERITVLHNALSPAEYMPTRSPSAVRSEFGADRQTLVIGTFAHLSEKKGYRELWAAVPNVLRRFPDTQFWIVGRGELRQELEREAHAKGFLSKLRFTGFRQDAADLMNALDIFALPSRREPFGLVYLEAALLGKPVVGCRAGGAVEVIADGETGLLVEVGNGPAVAEALLTLAENRTAPPNWAAEVANGPAIFLAGSVSSTPSKASTTASAALPQ